MCRLNDTIKTAYYDITLAILCSVSCIFYIRRFGSFCAPRLKRNYTEFRKNHISQTYVVSHNLDNDQHADNCGVKRSVLYYRVCHCCICCLQQRYPPVSPSLSSASTFAPAFTRAKMASALPEGQEALGVESACSENTPVGGQAHPISSNTTEVRHTAPRSLLYY